MGRTYTWADALTRVGGQYARNIEDANAIFAANEAQFLIWDMYDWRETLEELPPFWLIANEQDYGAPTAVIPSDFQALRRAYLVNVDSNYGREELKIKRDIMRTNMRALPRDIGYAPETNTFRTWPRCPEGLNPSQWLVDGTYKKKPTKITTSNIASSLLPWDDRHFRVACTALKWALAPEISPEKDKLFVSAVYQIRDMADKEGLDLGDPQGISPAEPLVREWGVR